MPFLLNYDALTHLLTLITSNGARELGNAWWDLQALHKDSLLTLNADVLGPSDEAGKVSLGLDVSTNAEVLGSLLDQGVGGFLHGLSGIVSRNCRGLLYFFDLGHPGLMILKVRLFGYLI